MTEEDPLRSRFHQILMESGPDGLLVECCVMVALARQASERVVVQALRLKSDVAELDRRVKRTEAQIAGWV
jgi:hypothetical protein